MCVISRHKVPWFFDRPTAAPTTTGVSRRFGKAKAPRIYKALSLRYMALILSDAVSDQANEFLSFHRRTFALVPLRFCLLQSV